MLKYFTIEKFWGFFSVRAGLRITYLSVRVDCEPLIGFPCQFLKSLSQITRSGSGFILTGLLFALLAVRPYPGTSTNRHTAHRVVQILQYSHQNSARLLILVPSGFPQSPDVVAPTSRISSDFSSCPSPRRRLVLLGKYFHDDTAARS